MSTYIKIKKSLTSLIRLENTWNKTYHEIVGYKNLIPQNDPNYREMQTLLKWFDEGNLTFTDLNHWIDRFEKLKEKLRIEEGIGMK